MSLSDPLRLVVFDCDGTLVDSQHSIIDCMKSAFEGYGLAAPLADDVRSVVGLSLDEAIRRIAPGLPPRDIDVLVENYKRAFRHSRLRGEHDDPLYPGTLEVLRELEEAGYLLGVATGKSMRGLTATLEQHGILGRFQTLQTADIAPGKPHPGMLHRAADETGVEVENMVMIGDTSFDMQMAKNAGCVGIGVRWGYHPVDELKATGAQHVMSHYNELMPLLGRLF